MKINVNFSKKVRIDSLSPGDAFILRKNVWLITNRIFKGSIRAVRLEDGSVGDFHKDSLVQKIAKLEATVL